MNNNLKNFLLWFLFGSLFIAITENVLGVDRHNMIYAFNDNKSIYEFIYKSIDTLVEFVWMVYAAAYFKVFRILDLDSE